MLRGLTIVLAVALVAPAWAIDPADDSGTISIMKPEPGAKPAKHKSKAKPASEGEATPSKGFGVKQDSRRGSSNPVYPAPVPGPQAPAAVPRIEQPSRRATVPPSYTAPGTGRTLPNLPSASGTETLQDKSVRCAHQAGVYGPNLTGNPNAYVGGCINQ
jgi:hypothetical protein